MCCRGTNSSKKPGIIIPTSSRCRPWRHHGRGNVQKNPSKSWVKMCLFKWQKAFVPRPDSNMWRLCTLSVIHQFGNLFHGTTARVELCSELISNNLCSCWPRTIINTSICKHPYVHPVPKVRSTLTDSAFLCGQGQRVGPYSPSQSFHLCRPKKRWFRWLRIESWNREGAKVNTV